MESLTVAFDPLPMAHWGPLFNVLCLERPSLRLEWDPADFPLAGRPLLEGADVGLFVEPPGETGLSYLTLESHPMVVAVAVGHELARREEVRVADILDQPFPGGDDHHPEWRAFWTLDAQRGGPPRFTEGEVRNHGQGLEVIASGRAIATLAAPAADGLPHPGIVTVPLVDGPVVRTRLVWRSGDDDSAVRTLVDLARDMTRG